MGNLKSYVILTISIFLTLQSLSFGQDEEAIKEIEEEEPPPSDTADVDEGTTSPKDVTFPIVNRTEVEKECTEIGRCWSSDKDMWICANDDRVYQNPGVLVCAQQCNSSLELEVFCKMNTMSPEFANDRDHCANCKTRSKAMAVITLTTATETETFEKEAAVKATLLASEMAANAAANPEDPAAVAAAAETAAEAANAAARVKIAHDAVVIAEVAVAEKERAAFVAIKAG